MSNLLSTPPAPTMDFDNNQNLHHQNPIYHRNNNTYDLNSRIMLTAVLSLGFVIVLVIILHIYARCVLRSPHGRLATALSTLSHRHTPPSEAPKSGLDPIVIQALPSFLYKQSNGQQEDQIECSVCLSYLEEGELARKLPNCSHVFHMACIDMWLTGQSTCHVCRSEAAPRMAPHEREPPMRSEQLEEVVPVVVDSESHDQNEIEHDLVQCNCNETSNNKANTSNGNAPTSSSTTTTTSSFRLSSFRRMLGRDRSSSSRRIQVCSELDLERQGNH